MQQYKQISVYDKLGNLITEFTNQSFPTSDEQAKNKIYTPRVHLTQNGESTLTFSMFKDSERWNLVKDPENRWYCDGRVYEAMEDSAYTYEGELVNVTLSEEWYLLSRDFAQVHNVDPSVESLDEHTVKVLPKSPMSNKLTVNGVVYEDSQVVDARGVVQPRGSAGYALWALLKGNHMGWRIGICDVIVDGFNAATDYGVFNLESDMKDLLTNIKYVQELWGGIFVWDSLNKTVSLRDESKPESDFNQWKGVEFRQGKNLLSVPQITVDNKLITKAYILGNGNLNIKAINNNLTYVEDYSYTDSVYEGYLQNSNIYYTGDADTSGQTQLLEWGKKEVAKYCKPRVQYEFDVLDRRTEPGYEHEVFDIDDIVHLVFIDPVTNRETVVEQRIIDWEYGVFDNKDSKVMIGDKTLNFVEIFNLTYKNTLNSVKTDWSGTINANDITIDIPDYLAEYYEMSSGGGYGGSLADLNALNAEKNIEVITSQAEFEKYADDTYATIKSFTLYQKETDEKISQNYTAITQLSDELQAQITLEANHYSELYATDAELDGKIASSNARINILANDLQGQIYLETTHYQENSQGIQEAKASIVITADALGSRIQLNADKIEATRLEVENLRAETLDAVLGQSQYFYTAHLALPYSGDIVSVYPTTSVFVTDIGYSTNKLGYVTEVWANTERKKIVAWTW